jgi:hypothetical protein
MLLQRFVNKGPGELGLDLRIGGDTTYTLPGGLLKGIQMIGLPLDPFVSTGGELLGIAENDVMLARYNSTRAGYDLYPNTGSMVVGNGFFTRMNAPAAFTVAGRGHPGTAVSIACKPGWNLVSSPLKETVATSRVQVVKSFNSPSLYSEAIGVDIGTEFFQFVRGANDAATGAPETGTLVAATQFETGKAYYIRVLAAEGVSLVFFPSTTPQRPGRVFVPTGWQLSANIRQGAATARVVLGQSSTATRNVDRKEDGPMPPRYGGFQVIIESAQPMYRDVRRLGVGEKYKLRIEGLRPGQEYTMDFLKAFGNAPSFVIYDAANGVFTTKVAPTYYRFRASGSVHRMEIWVNGGGL